jgi:hypothetical protein
MPAGGQAISQGSQPGCNRGRRGKSGNQGKVRCPQFSSSKQADAVGTLLPSLRQYRPLAAINMSSTIFKGVLICAILGVIIADSAYTPYVFGLLLVAYIIYELKTLKKIVSRSIDGEFVIARKKRPIKLWLVILTILLTFASLYKDTADVYTPMLLWAVVMIQVFKYFIYKRKKPALLAISGKELVLNDENQGKINLANLTRIGVYDLSGDIRCFFNDKSSQRIGNFNYYDNDLRELIVQMQSKSEFDVELTERAKIFINSR